MIELTCDPSEPTECSCLSAGRGRWPPLKRGASLRELVKNYRSGVRPLHQHLASCLLVTTFEDLIGKASGADGKTSSHQRRIRPAVLTKMETKLRQHAGELRAAKNFHDLLEIIEKLAVKGFGSLARYDCALRIGTWLGRMPDRVYLHAGTRKGAHALGLKPGGRSLRLSDCPVELHELRAFEIEDFLCVYKAYLR